MVGVKDLVQVCDIMVKLFSMETITYFYHTMRDQDSLCLALLGVQVHFVFCFCYKLDFYKAELL